MCKSFVVICLVAYVENIEALAIHTNQIDGKQML